jgi:hypothetical protein
VTSVYGYPGPLASDSSGHFVSNGLRAIKELWRKQNVVTAFTRLNPLLGNHALLVRGTPAEACGSTIAIDLTRPPDEIRRGYGKSLKYRINVARRSGVIVEHDAGLKQLARFIEIYEQTMMRNQASPSYFFDRDYFERLFEAFPNRAHLFTAFHEGTMVAGSVFVETDGICQGRSNIRPLRRSKNRPVLGWRGGAKLDQLGVESRFCFEFLWDGWNVA